MSSADPTAGIASPASATASVGAWSLTLTARGSADSDRIAAVVARHAAAGDAVLLDGELAAGKTHVVKAFVAALGSPATVTSPTYALVHMYDGGRLKVLHVDAYRLKSPAEFADLGLDDYREDGVTLIEWGQLVAARVPDALSIRIGFVAGAPDDRVITISYAGSGWRGLRDDLARADVAASGSGTP